MQRIKNIAKKTQKSVAAFYRRHRVFCMVGTFILACYVIIRTFFTPPLISDIDFSRAYYDRNGELLRLTLSADDKYRMFAPLDKIAPSLKRATILYEDKYFYIHPGVNPVSLIKSAAAYFGGAPRPAGASTITMQVARMKYGLNTKKPTGKLIQIAAAIYIDAFHSKHEILQAYLNMAPYGGNIEGVAAASNIYFQKGADKLSTIESITLATIPQNPVKRGLHTHIGIANMSTIRTGLVGKWGGDVNAQKNLETLAQMPIMAHGTRELPFFAPHFVDREIARDNYWTKLGDANSTKINTTIDLNLQRTLEATLSSQIERRKNLGIQNAAAILVNYKTMETLAYIGSANYFDKSIYGENDGVRARRSPGSTLKPLIYAAAANRGFIHGMTLLKDAKINFGVYAPENADGEFYGPVLARDALTHSRNIPAINLTRKIGFRNFYKLLSDCGVSNLLPAEHYGISIALGGAEVSMFELAGIYATMANLGMRREIKTRIDTPDTKGTQLLSPEAFFLTLDMLGRASPPQKNIPFAKNRATQIRHYWKTGTSSSFRDAWTAGIFGDYVLIVWIGNFDGTPNNAFSGARAAAPIYFAMADAVAQYMKAHNTPVKNNNFLREDMNISQIEMCEGVGAIAGPHCPHSVPAYFIPGVSPIDTASVYRAVPIDNKTGRRACNNDPQTTHMEIYEFWDAEYLDMFRRAGARRNTPPPFVPGCDLNDIIQSRNAPVITSPADGMKFVITSNSDFTPVTFQAVSDNPQVKIFWFLDDELIGTTKSGDVLRHNVQMGEHTVRVADELGMGGSSDFAIIK